MRSVISNFYLRSAIFAPIVLGALLFSATSALAVEEQLQDCAGATNPNLSCVSNDININQVAQMTVGEGGQPPIANCTEGSMGLVDIKLNTAQNAQERYDVLSWFGTQGNDPRDADTNACWVSSLPDLPDQINVLDIDGDACFDITDENATIDQYYFQVPFTCADNFGLDAGGDPEPVPDGEADVFALITWYQSEGALNCGIANEGLIPGTNPKCDISLLTGLDIEVLPEPSMTVEKSSSTVAATENGQVITYNYLVTNTGDTTLTGIVLTDDNDEDDMSCPSDTLAPAATMNCTATHTVTQGEIDAGDDICNTVSADANEVDPVEDNLCIPVGQAPAMTVVKSSATTLITGPGTVTYSYLVTNIGNVVLTTITISDNNDEDDASCPSDTLAVGAQMTCTATHAVTQGEIDAGGEICNTVTVDSSEGATDNDDLCIPIAFAPSMDIAKSANATVISGPGVVTYTYIVTNDGNVTLTGISVSDDNDEDDMSCPGTTLAPGASMQCTATHNLTQDEWEDFGSPTPGSGVLHNEATASSNESDDVSDDLNIPLREQIPVPVNNVWMLALLVLMMLGGAWYFRSSFARRR